jgi:signal peptide peptidase SppA
MSLPNLKELLVKIDFKRLNPKTWDQKSVKDAMRSFISIAFCLLLFIGGYYVANTVHGTLNSEDVGYEEEGSEEQCNVVGIELRGNLLTYIPQTDFNDSGELAEDEVGSEDILATIEDVEGDDSIKAILLEIDSMGGMPVAGEEISEAVKNAKKPIVAFIRGIGASAAYFAASGADQIFASKYSEVGGIGVTMSYLDYVAKNRADGLSYNSLSSGRFKDAGDPDKALTQEERNLFMRDVNIMHQNFVKTVAENRKLDIEKVKKLADGSTLLGQAALENGLIDQIGGYEEAKKYVKEKIGEDVVACW